MDTILMDCEGEDKKGFDDSGCVQDGPPMSPPDPGHCPPELLDLSDDVLLYILKHCSPRDLKALGYTCPRLGRLVLDRTLWKSVDAREPATGRVRMRWLLAHALGANTTELLLQGYAREARGCLGHVNRTREEVEEEKAMKEKAIREGKVPPPLSDCPPMRGDTPVQIIQVDPATRLQRLYMHHLPSAYAAVGTPVWPEEGPTEVDPEDVVLLDGSCPGPQFTLTQCMMKQLRIQCYLTSLALEYCNINCNTTGLSHFPATLKKLSLKGSKCYNLPLDKSFLFNIQDYLPHLEFLNLSECEWLEPASFLPLSKVPNLTHLVMRDCYRLSEFVAYASLSTRYGFKVLKMMDFRGSPVADSEVSALGWLPRLEELYISPAPKVPPHPPDHSHYRDEPLPAHAELLPWEKAEPEYFKIKPRLVEPMDNRATTSKENIEKHIEKLRDYESNLCLHGVEFNLCTDGMRRTNRLPEPESDEQQKSKTATESPKDDKKSPKRKEEMDYDKPGPSPKRRKDEEAGPAPKKRRLVPDNQKPCSSKSADNASISFKYGKKPKYTRKDQSGSSDEDNAPCSSKSVVNASTSSKYKRSPKKATKDDFDSSDEDIVPCSSKSAINASTSSKNKKSPKKAPQADCDSSDEDMPCSSKSVNNASTSSKYKKSPKKAPQADFDTSDEDMPCSSKSVNNASTSSKYKKSPKKAPKDDFDSSDEDMLCSSKSANNASTSSKYKKTPKKAPKDDSDSSGEDNMPCSSKSANNVSSSSKYRKNKRNIPKTDSGSSDEDNMPCSSTSADNTSTSSKYKYMPRNAAKDDSDSSDDDNIPLKMLCRNGVNEGASTSKSHPLATRSAKKNVNPKCKKPNEHPKECKCNDRKYEIVRFRQNMDPVFVRRDGSAIERGEINENVELENQNREVRPRAHVLYVNVGQQLHTVYRLSIQNEPPIFYSFARNSHLRYRPNVGNIFYTPPTPHLDAESLVTDSAIRRFGRSEMEEEHVVQIGIQRPNGESLARPNRSSLRILSLTGFRNITDRSLLHLATAAPHLRRINFTETSVTSEGVESFRSLRPDCEVIYSPYVDKDDD